MASPGPCLEAINLHELAFSADQVRSLRELLVTAVLESPELSQFHTIYTGIKNDKEIGIIDGSFGLVGLAAQGCNPTAQCFQVHATPKLWHPRYLEIIIDQCMTDVYASLVRLALNCGIDVMNLTTTEYFPFILNILKKDIKKMILRMAWFGDEDADNVANGGLITDGVDVGYFNVFDGFWAQLADVITATPARRTTLQAGNDQITYALQNTVYTPAHAYEDIMQVIDDSPAELAAAPDRVLLVTRSVKQRILRYLQAQGVVLNFQLSLNGLESTVWDGITLYSIPLWDQMIQAYQDNGTHYNDPHRILLTTKSNLAIGMACTSLFENVNTFYNQTSRMNRIEAMDAFDAKVLFDGMFQLGI
jgi:hypothetical protein